MGFSHTLEVHIRDFKGQQKGKVLTEHSLIQSDSLINFREKLWDIIKVHVKREVVCRTENDEQIYSFSENFPVEADLDKFATIYDITGRRSLSIQEINVSFLNKNRGKTNNLLIYPHGFSVSSSSIWGIVQKSGIW